MKRNKCNLLNAVLLQLMVTLGMSLCFSCSQPDDVEGIFTTASQWSLTGFFYTPNWDKSQCSMLDIPYSGKESCNQNRVSFYDNGNVVITMPGCTLNAYWQADGEERSFSISTPKVKSGSLKNISLFSQKFYEELCAAVWYRGDSNYLELFGSDQHYYLLFAPIKE